MFAVVSSCVGLSVPRSVWAQCPTEPYYTCEDVPTTLTFTGQPLSPTVGVATTPVGTVTLDNAGLRPFFNVASPSGARNRWLWRFELATSVPTALGYVTVQHSCSPSCATPLPSLVSAAAAQKRYEHSGQILNGKGSVTTNPRFLGEFDFAPADDSVYPNCRCDHMTDTSPVRLVNEMWFVRGSTFNAPGGSTAATTVTGTASVIDICNGRGDEVSTLPVSLYGNLGCTCDAGWYGNRCGRATQRETAAEFQTAFLPCCATPLPDLSKFRSNISTVTHSNATYSTFWSTLADERVFTYNSSWNSYSTDPERLNSTGGIDYTLWVRNLSPDLPECRASQGLLHPHVKFATSCDATTNVVCLDAPGIRTTLARTLCPSRSRPR